MSVTWADEQFDLLEAAYDEVPIEAKARIEQLEAQVRELARENAELKQVPNRSDDSPRCPLRDGMTGEMGVCDKRCALLVRVGGVFMCAKVAMVDDNAQVKVVRAVNYWNEVG